MFYCFDGLFRERPFEILAYVAGTTVIIVYIIANFIASGWEGQNLRIVSYLHIYANINIPVCTCAGLLGIPLVKFCIF